MTIKIYTMFIGPRENYKTSANNNYLKTYTLVTLVTHFLLLFTVQ